MVARTTPGRRVAIVVPKRCKQRGIRNSYRHQNPIIRVKRRKVIEEDPLVVKDADHHLPYHRQAFVETALETTKKESLPSNNRNWKKVIDQNYNEQILVRSPPPHYCMDRNSQQEEVLLWARRHDNPIKKWHNTHTYMYKDTHHCCNSVTHNIHLFRIFC